MLKVKIFTSIVLFCLCSFLYAQIDSVHSAIIYGKDNSYVIKAPQGWTLDKQSGLSLGLFAVFYPKASSWKDAVTVMYCNTASKKVKGNETIDDIINFDINRFKKQNNAEVNDSDPIITQDNKTAIVKKFYDKINGNYEAVAYINENNVVVLLVISSRDIEDFEKSYDAFKEFVGAYYYLTDNVDIKEK